MRNFIKLTAGLIGIAILIRIVVALVAGESSQAALLTMLKPIATVYLAFFGNPVAGFLLSIILLLALSVLLSLLISRHYMPARRELDRISGRLGAIRSTPGDVNSLPGIADAFRNSRLLGTAWGAFETTLVRRRKDGNTIVQSSARPTEYFTVRSLEVHGINLRSFRPVANYFVGAGLLFTFMGLIAGLYFASRGMKTADLNEARSALVDLLGASTLKFSTSVTGIGASLLFAIVLRFTTGSIEGRMDRICKLLEYHMPLVTTEALMLEQISETQQQIECIRQLDSTMQTLIATTQRNAA